MIKNLYEIFEEFEKATTRNERIEILKRNKSIHLTQFLQYTFDPQYQFYITEFPKNYKKPNTLPGIRIAGLESEIRKTYLFLKGNPTADILTTEKRNILLLQILESFEPKEAELYIKMLQKNLPYPYLTKSLINETFPNLLPN